MEFVGWLVGFFDRWNSLFSLLILINLKHINTHTRLTITVARHHTTGDNTNKTNKKKKLSRFEFRNIQIFRGDDRGIELSFSSRMDVCVCFFSVL